MCPFSETSTIQLFTPAEALCIIYPAGHAGFAHVKLVFPPIGTHVLWMCCSSAYSDLITGNFVTSFSPDTEIILPGLTRCQR